MGLESSFPARVLALLLACLAVLNISSADVTQPTETELTEASSFKTPVKRNVAWVARSGHRKFFFDPRPADKRNMAWWARSGGRDNAIQPSSDKRDMDFEDVEDDSSYEPYNVDDAYFTEDGNPYYLDKRNLASLVNSKTIPSFVVDNKRHLGSAMRYRDLIDSPRKRFFASLLKSDSPPPSLYPRFSRRFSYFDHPEKRFFSSLLENDYGAPGEDIDKRSFASMLDRKTPYKGKRSFASLLKSESGIGMPGKRYYSSLLDDSKLEDKRFVGSLLKSTALRNVAPGTSDQLLGSIYDRQSRPFDKRNFASVLNRQTPFMSSKQISKRHIGSLRDSPKRFYGSILDNTDSDDKRSLGSILKSSSYSQQHKKNIGAALRYRTGKRADENDDELTEEELELEALQKRYIGSILDNTPGKRHFASILDSRDGRSDMMFPEDPYEYLNDDEKRHIASVLDSRSMANKRFLGSVLDSDRPYMRNDDDKRHLGSTVNSRMRFVNEGKRFLGSAINSRMNYVNGVDKEEADKRSTSEVHPNQPETDEINEDKRFYGSILDNTRNNAKTNEDKRFVGSALKSKSRITDTDPRSKRNADEKNAREKRSLDYFEENTSMPWLENQNSFEGNLEFPQSSFELESPALQIPDKRFLRK